MQLDTTRTPGTVNNFVTLSRWKYYDGSSIFRTDTSIDIIQGGGKTNTDSPGYTIPDEGGTFTWSDTGGKGPFTYQAGDLVMARVGQPEHRRRPVVLRRRAERGRTSTPRAPTSPSARSPRGSTCCRRSSP